MNQKLLFFNKKCNFVIKMLKNLAKYQSSKVTKSLATKALFCTTTTTTTP